MKVRSKWPIGWLKSFSSILANSKFWCHLVVRYGTEKQPVVLANEQERLQKLIVGRGSQEEHLPSDLHSTFWTFTVFAHKTKLLLTSC